MITWIKRALLGATILALLATNVLTLTSATFNAALSGALASALGVRTVSGMLQSKLAARDAVIRQQKATDARRRVAARKFGKRLAARTRRVAAKSVATLPAEAIPVLGVTVLIADTGYELYAACETVRDLEQFYAELGLATPPPDTLHKLCEQGPPLPGGSLDETVRRLGKWWKGLAHNPV